MAAAAMDGSGDAASSCTMGDSTPSIPLRRWMNRSAVAVVRAPVRGEPSVLMIRRARRQGDPWSGQMSFPGGRRERADKNSLHTALRETREEVGVDLDPHAPTARRQPELITRSHRGWRPQIVTPWLFSLDAAPDVCTGEEAPEYVWVPTRVFTVPATPLRWPVGPLRVAFPSYEYEGFVIWGLSLMIIRGLPSD